MRTISRSQIRFSGSLAITGVLVFAGLIAITFGGCQATQDPENQQVSDSDAPNSNTNESSGQQDSSNARDKRYTAAITAKDALFAKLSGRLMEVMQSEGPVAAIRVCSQEATTIAKSPLPLDISFTKISITSRP